MARYGIDYYGSAYYGLNNLVNFNAAPFLSRPYDYGVIQLTWASPTGNWDYIRLVRRTAGFPTTVEDGNVLFEDAKSGARTVYIDAGQVPVNVPLIEGEIYYYTLFVHDLSTSTWKSAGNTMQTVVKNYNTTELMYDYLPTIVTSEVPYDSSVSKDNDFLKRFLKLFALNLDLYRTQSDNIANKHDIAKFDGNLVPLFMHQLGLTYEPELGLAQSKIILRNAIHLYQTKGSRLGLKDYIKSYVGYDNVVAMGKNLMLDKNDSSFEENIGNWASVSNATLSWWPVTATPLVGPYAETASPTTFTNLQHGVLKVVSTASATTEIAIGGTLSSGSPKLLGIPVVAGTAYTFSGRARAGTTARSVKAKLYWYDVNGVALTPSSLSSGVNDAVGSWTLFSISNVTAPTGALFCIPHISIVSTAANEVHYIDALQFEVGASPTYFQDARQIEITLKATRINEVLNPGFESDISHWHTTNANFLLSTDEALFVSSSQGIPISTGAAQMYSTDGGLVTLKTDPMVVTPGVDYTFSIYLSTEDLVAHTATPFISWYDSSSTLISTATGTDTSFNTTAWTRAGITGTSPSNAATAVIGITWTAAAKVTKSITGITAAGGKVTYATSDTSGLSAGQSVIISGASTSAYNGTYQIDSITTNTNFKIVSTATGASSTATAITSQEVSVDSALFEKSAFVGPYFDGTHGVSQNTDVFWEGTTQASRSHYYKNRITSELRLIQTIPDYVNYGSTFELLLAQPG